MNELVISDNLEYQHIQDRIKLICYITWDMNSDIHCQYIIEQIVGDELA